MSEKPDFDLIAMLRELKTKSPQIYRHLMGLLRAILGK